MAMTMNRSAAILRRNALASTAILFGAIFTIFLIPAYGQQDVDPTWYDPTPSAAIAHPAQPTALVNAAPVTVQQHQTAVKSQSNVTNAAKSHTKDKQLNQSRHDAARKTVGTPAARNDEPGTVSHTTLDARSFDIYRSPNDPTQ